MHDKESSEPLATDGGFRYKFNTFTNNPNYELARCGSYADDSKHVLLICLFMKMTE